MNKEIQSLKSEEGGGKKDRSRVKKWLGRILVLLLLIIILLLTLRQCGYIQFPWEQPSLIAAGDIFPDEGEAKDGQLGNMDEAEIKEQMQRIADASYFSFKINARPVFDNGESTGNLEIENPNYNIYPMVVQIALDDTGEIIFDSGGMYPNQHIDSDTLTKDLNAGEYKATAYINAYDPDTKEWLGQHEAELIITIKN